ncbi:unnamed protein product [Arabis nemorensis]|uniref:Uncharacterized protein n=1 Tax=Arabis nemorensis TaxID=586526 RepID=A0A565B0Z1_9BRAS|nr:unnamed protein product [Arabis nemorensis]
MAFYGEDKMSPFNTIANDDEESTQSWYKSGDDYEVESWYDDDYSDSDFEDESYGGEPEP